MADFNKKPEFQSYKADVTEEILKEFHEMKDEEKKIILDNYVCHTVVDIVGETEKRCKRQFRKWLAELVMIVSGISIWIYLICMIVERAKVLPTEPYRDMNGLELIFAVVTILSAVFAGCVRQRNM